ncbi:metal ion transporter, metal ion (Mn2+/Fe2+) transporter (Nramp) family protein [Candida albicans]|uniref:Metal ion transporter, metal ion (Mn2+/Fe2+) transporter (Nramp) family protein n=1 Tax=Candida albicans TaxID=5476 RepID=A0A8H6BWU4_CANAX|nr:metal ion transporter, metal ion (Mn2+/Fe2+) transporter (Nramp) family protein [Candida albicans]
MTTTSSSTNESIRPKNNHTTISTTGVSTTLDQTTTTRFRNNYDDNNNNSVISKDSSTFAYVVNRSKSVLKKYGSFVGPGMLISVAYMDPGNYATGITAGASNEYSLLFIVFLSNVIAIFLQSLCIKLGSVTGYDLARCCREYLPKQLNWVLWFLAECAIIATDVAEVIGSAIALNILLKIPLPAGVVITIIDVLFVLMAYRADTSSMKFVKIFEYAVGALVMVVVVCFAVELSQIHASARDIFRGFVPSKQMFDGNGMTIATSIIGSTVMIHSLFLGSGLVQPRLRDFDVKHGYVNLDDILNKNDQPQFPVIESSTTTPSEKKDDAKNNVKYSIVELTITLITLALFVNSAILIVSGSTLYGTEEAIDADLYTIHDLLSRSLAPAVGTIFMVALLASGQSAGIVCTIAGQIVSEGHINWTLKPWLRRLVTRSISIIPCLIISVCIGRNGLGIALNISQVVISILLPPLTAPLIYFTCSKKIMKVELNENDEAIGVTGQEEEVEDEESNDQDTNGSGKKYKYMTNNWITSIVAVIIWFFVSTLNVYAIYEMAKNGVSG